MLTLLSRATKRAVVALATVGSLAASTLDAQPITFYFRGLASGTIDNTVISRQAFEVTINSDISAVAPNFNGDPAHEPVFGTINIAGLGLASFIQPLYIFRNSDIVGFGDQINADLIDIRTNAVLGYNLDAAFAAVTVPGLYQNGQFSAVETSLGSLTLSEIYDRQFEAVVGTTVTPEPGTILLLAAGMGAMALIRIRRKV